MVTIAVPVRTRERTSWRRMCRSQTVVSEYDSLRRDLVCLTVRSVSIIVQDVPRIGMHRMHLRRILVHCSHGQSCRSDEKTTKFSGVHWTRRERRLRTRFAGEHRVEAPQPGSRQSRQRVSPPNIHATGDIPYLRAPRGIRQPQSSRGPRDKKEASTITDGRLTGW